MKTGANIKDQNAIVRMAEAGKDSEEISNALRINVDTVESFMPSDEEDEDKPEKPLTAAQKKKAAKEAADKEAAELDLGE